MTVTSLQAYKEQNSPHISGEAFCLACKAEWIGVAPVGTYQLSCRACGSSKGVFKHPCSVPEGELIRECYCGCRVFYVTPNGVHCWNCGKSQTNL